MPKGKTRENVRLYQKEHLGRHTSTNCLVELLPLPSPKLGHWLCAQHSQLPQLASREVYTNYCAPILAEHLRQRLVEYKPKAAVFYSVNPAYMYWLKLIAGVDSPEVAALNRLFIAKNECTLFAIVMHPSAKGVSKEYFHQAGRIFASTALG